MTDKTGLPENVAKILEAAQDREQRAAEDWLSAFSKKSEEALAKRAEEKKVAKPVNEQALIEALARKDHTEYDRMRGEVADTLGIRVGTLDDKVVALRKKRAIKTTPAIEPVDAAKVEAAAGDLVAECDVLTRFGKAIESAGLVGETSNAKILYLAVTSRLFDRPVSVAVKGVSAGGKSFTVESVLRFFPASAFFTRTGFSEKALYFSDEDFRHRFIVIFEAVGMESDYLSYVIRTLLSENRLSYELPVKTEDGMKPQLLEKEGPTGLITTGAKVRRKYRKPGLNVAFDPYSRPRMGKLQERTLFALIDAGGEAKTGMISEYCRDGAPTERQLYSQRRAARSIGARPVRREGRQWIWRLENAECLPRPK